MADNIVVQPDLFDAAHDVLYASDPAAGVTITTTTGGTIIPSTTTYTNIPIPQDPYSSRGLTPEERARRTLRGDVHDKEDIEQYLNDLVKSGARDVTITQRGMATWTVECEIDVPWDTRATDAWSEYDPMRPTFRARMTMPSLLEAARELNQVVQLYIAAMSIPRR